MIFNHQEDKGEIGTLSRSLIRQIESLWVFLDIVEVEPTNNIAERVLRYGVLWRKRSKGTQSLKGNKWWSGYSPSNKHASSGDWNLFQY
ncbi:MAG: transposase [Desulfobacterales bacterium]|nr:transposase [Desulfobacterales bacterium]